MDVILVIVQVLMDGGKVEYIPIVGTCQATSS